MPAENVLVTKRLQENNWAQAVEGGIDSSHISYLHNNDMYKVNNSTVDKLAADDGQPARLRLH